MIETSLENIDQYTVNMAIIAIISLYSFTKLFTKTKVPKINDLDESSEKEKEDEDCLGYIGGEILQNVSDIVAEVKTKVLRGGLNAKKRKVDKVEAIYPQVNVTKNGVIVIPHESIPPGNAHRNVNFVRNELQRYGYLEKDAILVDHCNPRALHFKNPRVKKLVLDGATIEDNNIEDYEDYINSLPEHHVFAGNLTGEHVIPEGDSVIIKLTDVPHFAIVGGTNSGKSKTAANICASLALSKYNQNAVFYYACGKGSSDYDALAAKTSPFPCAKPSVGEDPVIELAQVITAAFKEYEYRRDVLWPKLNEELGQTLSAYPEIEAEKRKVDSSFTIPRIVLMIDEYKAWMTLFESDALANAKKDDGIVAKLATLLRAARSYKFTIILSSQEFKADTFPPTMKAQTGNKLVHTVTSKQEAEYMGADFDKIKTFNPGDFILMSQGKFCKETKDSNITARLNYIGDIPAIFRYLETKECAKNGKDFEKHFLYSSGAGETEISKASDAKLVAMIRDVLFVREGWEIKEENDSDSYLPLVFSKGDRELAVGIIQKNEASDEDIVEKVNTTFPSLTRTPKLFFIRASATGKTKEAYSKNLGRAGDIGLSEENYMRILIEAKKKYIDGDSEEIFGERIIDKKVFPESIVVPAAAERKDTKIDLTIDELERISKLPGKSKEDKICKGEIFEEYTYALFRALGWSVFTIEDLLDGKERYYQRTSSGDKGLDGLFFPPEVGKVDNLRELTPEQSAARVGVQLKNYAKGIAVGEAQNAVISRTFSAGQNYRCLATNEPIERFLVIQSGDNWSAAAREEAKNMNIDLMGYVEIARLLRKLDTPEEQPADKKIAAKKLKKEGLTQVQIAEKLNVTRQYVSKILKK